MGTGDDDFDYSPNNCARRRLNPSLALAERRAARRCQLEDKFCDFCWNRRRPRQYAVWRDSAPIECGACGQYRFTHRRLTTVVNYLLSFTNAGFTEIVEMLWEIGKTRVPDQLFQKSQNKIEKTHHPFDGTTCWLGGWATVVAPANVIVWNSWNLSKNS